MRHLHRNFPLRGYKVEKQQGRGIQDIFLKHIEVRLGIRIGKAVAEVVMAQAEMVVHLPILRVCIAASEGVKLCLMVENVSDRGVLRTLACA